MLKDLFRIPNPSKGIKGHVERAISLLASQFSESPRLKGLISSFVEQLQDIQNSAQDLYDYRSIDTAQGKQLDGLGQILGVERRAGEGDEPYKARLKLKSFIIFSSGTPEQVMKILADFTAASQIEYRDMFPAGYQLVTNGTNFIDNTGLPPEQQVPHNVASELMLRVSPAAVEFVPVVATYGELPFRFGAEIRDQPLIVWADDPASYNGNLEATIPLPDTYYYYVNSGFGVGDLMTGGYSDISDYAILSLDDGGYLLLDDGGPLLLFSETPFYDIPGAGKYTELLYYQE